MKKKICSILLHFVPVYCILFLLLGSIINIPHDTDFGSGSSICAPLNDDEPMPRDTI